MPETQTDDASALALAGTTDPNSGLVYPSTDTENGWGAQVLRLLQHLLTCFAPAGELRVYETDAAADAVGVRAGRRRLGSTVLVYAGSETAVTDLDDDATTYVWLYNNAGTGAIGSGAAWPSVAHWRLAEVTMADGVITQILDRRGECVVGVVFERFAAAGRPAAAGNAGRAIVNTDTGKLNISDGSAWFHADGTAA